MSLHACMFTNTPDHHFIIDTHPDYEQVSFASPCSGHGFKFASVVGEIMADLAEKGMTRHDISLFRLNRFDRRSESLSTRGTTSPRSISGPKARGARSAVRVERETVEATAERNGKFGHFPRVADIRSPW